MERQCGIHGVVWANPDGTCPSCVSNAMAQRAMQEMAHQTLHGTANAMARADERSNAPLLPRDTFSDPAWQERTGRKCFQPIVLLAGFILLLTPSIFIMSIGNENIGVIVVGLLLFAPLTSLLLVGLLMWWWSICRAGGIPTWSEEMRCQYPDYVYYQRPFALLPCSVFGLLGCAHYRRTTGTSALEVPRFLVMCAIIVMLFVLGLFMWATTR